MIAVVAGAVAIGARGGDDEPVTAGPTTATSVPVVPGTDGAVLSVALTDQGGFAGPPLDLTVRVLDEDGGVVAERSSSEVEEAIDGGEVTVTAGLIVVLPTAGDYEVVAARGGEDVSCPVEVASGDQLIVPVLTRDALACGETQTVVDWASDSGEVGQTYVGLTEAEAEQQVEADGYTSRVAGRDGMGFIVTADLNPTRVDLQVFDGLVVSAALGGEPGVPAAPLIAESLAVVLSSAGGVLQGACEVQVVVDDEGVSLPWEQGPDAGGSVVLLFADPPAGPATLEVEACTLAFDLADTGTVVTIEVGPDGTVDLQRECPATVETLAEHHARVTEGFDQYEQPDGYVGLTEADARSRAEADGLTVRVVDRDGLSFGRDDDLRTDRVNLVLYDDEVRAAAIF